MLVGGTDSEFELRAGGDGCPKPFLGLVQIGWFSHSLDHATSAQIQADPSKALTATVGRGEGPVAPVLRRYWFMIPATSVGPTWDALINDVRTGPGTDARHEVGSWAMELVRSALGE